MSDKRAIWKYAMTGSDVTHDLPAHSFVVAVGQQAGEMVFWAEVDPNEDRKEPRRFLAVPTGGEFPAEFGHLGTVQFPNGLVWHLLEESLLPPPVD
jgi:hypothetical protein